MSDSIEVYQDLVQGFEEQTQALKNWVEDSTLDMAWKNKVKDKFRSEREASRFAGVMERIGNRQEAVRAAIDRAQRGASTWDRKHELELQIRTAKKATVYCDGVLDLAKRAADERRACRYLLQELKDIKSLLSRKRHAWICKFDMPFPLPSSLESTADSEPADGDAGLDAGGKAGRSASSHGNKSESQSSDSEGSRNGKETGNDNQDSHSFGLGDQGGGADSGENGDAKKEQDSGGW